MEQNQCQDVDFSDEVDVNRRNMLKTFALAGMASAAGASIIGKNFFESDLLSLENNDASFNESSKFSQNMEKSVSGTVTDSFLGNNFRIDVHCHHIPDFYRQSLANYGITQAGGVDLPEWTPELAINFMDKYNIQTQILSISEPGVFYIPDLNERVNLAKKINDYTSQELIYTPNSNRKGRFGGFAVLPLGDLSSQDIENACNEAKRAITTLKMDGIGLFSNYFGTYLGDPKLEPLMETLNDLGAMVFIHPVTPMSPPNLNLPNFLFEFPFDTTRAVVNLMYKNVLLKYPNIRWLLAHAGGAIPFLAYRTNILRYYPIIAQNLGISLLDDGNVAYSRLYYDTALSPAPSAMKSVREVTSVEHIMFATDWPFSSQIFVVPGDPAPQLKDSFNSLELENVNRKNALHEFPLLNQRLLSLA
ncbi:amidohydrolase family protein [Acinetobacter pittii]